LLQVECDVLKQAAKGSAAELASLQGALEAASRKLAEQEGAYNAKHRRANERNAKVRYCGHCNCSVDFENKGCGKAAAEPAVLVLPWHDCKREHNQLPGLETWRVVPMVSACRSLRRPSAASWESRRRRDVRCGCVGTQAG
jgi:hypothetical protein